MPTSGIPTFGMPTSGMPTSSIPTSDMPTSNMPTSSIPTSNIPTSGIPTSSIPTSSIPTSSIPTSGIPPMAARQIGNPDAAQDLYGLGVRVGFYLQALGMILYNYGDKTDYAKGLKMASGSISVSVLASWFVFASRGLFSPSEAFIVLLVLIILSFPAKATLKNSHITAGETMGLIILLLVELGTCSALLWMFARLVNTLPALETDNVVFFFAKVSINGWFRYLALVYCVIDAATSIWFASKVVRVTVVSWQPITDSEKESKIEHIMGWKDVRHVIQFLRWLIWALVVVAVELTVRWNHLSPSTNLQAPGQFIPLVTGIIIFVDSGLFAARHFLRYFLHHKSRFFKFIAATMERENTGTDIEAARVPEMVV